MNRSLNEKETFVLNKDKNCNTDTDGSIPNK